MNIDIMLSLGSCLTFHKERRHMFKKLQMLYTYIIMQYFRSLHECHCPLINIRVHHIVTAGCKKTENYDVGYVFNPNFKCDEEPKATLIHLRYEEESKEILVQI